MGSLLRTEISRLVSGEGDSAETEQEMKAEGAAALLLCHVQPCQVKPCHFDLHLYYQFTARRAVPRMARLQVGCRDFRWASSSLED